MTYDQVNEVFEASEATAEQVEALQKRLDAIEAKLEERNDVTSEMLRLLGIEPPPEERGQFPPEADESGFGGQKPRQRKFNGMKLSQRDDACPEGVDPQMWAMIGK